MDIFIILVLVMISYIKLSKHTKEYIINVCSLLCQSDLFKKKAFWEVALPLGSAAL